MKGICVAFLSLIIVISSLQAQGKSDYSETLNKFLEVTGTTAATDVLLVQLMEAAKKDYPGLKEEEWKNIEAVFNKERLEYREKNWFPFTRSI
jgi:hypothetical protein